MKREFSAISQFGSKSRSPAIKANIAKATSIGFELLDQYNNLNEKTSSHAKNEQLFAQLKQEYAYTTSAYDSLINHLESVVKQVTEENTLLKNTLKENDDLTLQQQKLRI